MSEGTASRGRLVFGSRLRIWFLLWRFSVILFSAECLAAAAIPRVGRLKTSGRFFRDDQSRVVILRGVNLAGNSKVPPFLPLPKEPSFEEWSADPAHYPFARHTDLKMLDSLPRLGVNVLRLLFSWEAYEPERGRVNPSYLDMLALIADEASNKGIYTIIDFHQDVYSRFRDGGCGDGFPKWATAVPREDPRNNNDCKDIWMIRGSLDPGVQGGFLDFFSDKDGFKTAYLQRLEDIAERFSGVSGVIGYDLLNEPFSDLFEQDLLSLYREAAVRIWQVDKSAILFLEPNLVTDTGKQTSLFFRPIEGQIAYAPHFYDASIAIDHAYATPLLAMLAFENMRQVSDSWKAPLFLGEFGAQLATVDGDKYIELIYQLLDEQLASGSQWNMTPGWKPQTLDGWNMEDFSIVSDDMKVRPKLFCPRPYAERISGRPISMVSASSTDSDCVDLKWSNSPTRTGETEFFVPKPAQGNRKLVIDTKGLPAGQMRCALSEDGFHVVCESGRRGIVEVALGYSGDHSKCSNRAAHHRTIGRHRSER
jgi:endoglycosylceramidase